MKYLYFVLALMADDIAFMIIYKVMTKREIPLICWMVLIVLLCSIQPIMCYLVGH